VTLCQRFANIIYILAVKLKNKFEELKNKLYVCFVITQKGDQMVTLTKAEERIMQILWDLERGFIKDIQEHFPDPKASLQYHLDHCKGAGEKGDCLL
jgi:hypothetical protein